VVTHGEEVRQRLLAAAVQLIPERGWSAVSTRVLAERAGVTPSVVHYHYPSMRALLNDAVLAAMRQVLAAMESFLDNASSPAEAVDGMLASVEQYNGADPMSLLFVEAYLAATRDEQLRDGINQVADGLRERLGQWLAGHGVAEPAATAAVLVASVDGLLLHRGLGVEVDARSVIRRLVN
jgi:AcrR family transcriptional regulator